MAKSLINLSRLQVAIVKEYGDKGVNVNLTSSRMLSVAFINSPLNATGREGRAKRASQTAVFVSRRYPDIAEITEIWVYFLRVETSFIVVSRTESVDTFAFDKNGEALTEPPEVEPESVPDDSLRPIAVYSTTANQTEITVTSLQFQGTVNQGLTLSPHFTVPGDATGLRRSASFPKSVTFDFASYSEKSLFPGEPKIKFVADGKAVFETAGQFSTSKNEDGLFIEFLKLEVPYPAFRRLAAGKKLTFKLGDYEYNLSEEQVEALRRMTEYVRE